MVNIYDRINLHLCIIDVNVSDTEPSRLHTIYMSVIVLSVLLLKNFVVYTHFSSQVLTLLYRGVFLSKEDQQEICL